MLWPAGDWGGRQSGSGTAASAPPSHQARWRPIYPHFLQLNKLVFMCSRPIVFMKNPRSVRVGRSHSGREAIQSRHVVEQAQQHRQRRHGAQPGGEPEAAHQVQRAAADEALGAHIEWVRLRRQQCTFVMTQFGPLAHQPASARGGRRGTWRCHTAGAPVIS